jgi:hypothetical protein
MIGRTGRGRTDLRWPGFGSAACIAGLAALLAPATGPALGEGRSKTVAICVTNSLDEPITYEYRWGLGSWSWDRLDVGTEVEHRLEVDPREGVPQLQVRFRRSFGEGDLRTVLRATPVSDQLECEPIFASPTPEELAAQREAMLQSAHERWQDAAREADGELASALDLYFDVSRKDRAIVRVWKLGDTRAVVLGRISELRNAARPAPVSLWGEGRYLIEIFDHVDVERIESFVLDAKERPEITWLRPQLGSL